ncbi:MAG: hypothetical protein CVT49_08625 [candidate division Zixibacteria bacterium HGW-Zixibacteria-1]|nr:MAG: hypothetical protein CVT49_08625 [candidate division Zixibacteria bacterium HGW-Zixibacteria-1]
MKKAQRHLKNIQGFSLLEILIAMFLSAVVLTVIFRLFITQHKNWSIQEQVTDMQQNARAAMDELGRQIRMAGHELPLGLQGIIAYNTNPDTIIITYADGGCDAPTETDMPQATSAIDCNGHDISCFYDGQWAYIFHPDSGGGEFFEISNVATGSSQIEHNTCPLSKAYARGAIVISLQRIKYFIDNTDSLHPNLMMELPGRSPQIYAENVADLQFRYTMKNGLTVDVPVIIDDLREVEIFLMAKTSLPDSDFPNDPYRQVQYTSRINLRNFDI